MGLQRKLSWVEASAKARVWGQDNDNEINGLVLGLSCWTDFY